MTQILILNEALHHGLCCYLWQPSDRHGACQPMALTYCLAPAEHLTVSASLCYLLPGHLHLCIALCFVPLHAVA